MYVHKYTCIYICMYLCKLHFSHSKAIIKYVRYIQQKHGILVVPMLLKLGLGGAELKNLALLCQLEI
jgi:hypothetical protein